MTNNSNTSFIQSNWCYILLIIATVGDLAIPFIIAPFHDKYSHLTMVMSSLGNKNFHLHSIYNIWLVIAGVMLIIGSVKLYTEYVHISRILSICLLLFIIIFAVGACVLSGIFSIGDTKELNTISEKIHGYGSAIGFSILVFAPLIVAVLSVKSNNISMAIISFISFILALAFFLLFILSDKEKFSNTIISYEGLWQRLSLLCMYAPITILSLKKVFSLF